MAVYTTNNFKYVLSTEDPIRNTTTVQMVRHADSTEGINFSIYCRFAQNNIYQTFSGQDSTIARLTAHFYGAGGYYISSQEILYKTIYDPVETPVSLWGRGKMYNWNVVDNTTGKYVTNVSRCGSSILSASYSSLDDILVANNYKIIGPPVSYEPFMIRFLTDGAGDIYTARTKVLSGTYPADRSGMGNNTPFYIHITNDAIVSYAITLDLISYPSNTILGSFTFGNDSAEWSIELESRGYYKYGNWTDSARFYEKVGGVWLEKHGFKKNGGVWTRVR